MPEAHTHTDSLRDKTVSTFSDLVDKQLLGEYTKVLFDVQALDVGQEIKEALGRCLDKGCVELVIEEGKHCKKHVSLTDLVNKDNTIYSI